MRVLIGYSTCPHTRAAFEALGHEVWTCDLREDAHPRHICGNVWDHLGAGWDLGIFHPTCTYLTTSAAWAYADPDFETYPGVGYHQRPKPGTLTGKARRDARAAAVSEVEALLDLPFPVFIENPGRSFLSSHVGPAWQQVQPYDFGDDASKLTGIWTNAPDMPRLTPLLGSRVPGRIVVLPSGKTAERWANQTDAGQNKLTPGPDRWLDRSRTYPGIAAAMGRAWGSAMEDA